MDPILEILNRNNINYTIDDPGSEDINGNPYISLVVATKEHNEKGLYEFFEQKLLNFLGDRRFVRWRLFPVCLSESYRDFETNKKKHRYLIRCRLTAYEK